MILKYEFAKINGKGFYDSVNEEEHYETIIYEFEPSQQQVELGISYFLDEKYKIRINRLDNFRKMIHDLDLIEIVEDYFEEDFKEWMMEMYYNTAKAQYTKENE